MLIRPPERARPRRETLTLTEPLRTTVAQTTVMRGGSALGRPRLRIETRLGAVLAQYEDGNDRLIRAIQACQERYARRAPLLQRALAWLLTPVNHRHPQRSVGVRSIDVSRVCRQLAHEIRRQHPPEGDPIRGDKAPKHL
ncbi:MAG: hypothetical protein ACKVPX_15410 [Myxococcaceae bacterium]